MGCGRARGTAQVRQRREYKDDRMGFSVDQHKNPGYVLNSSVSLKKK
jgi:hypothetical protein